MKKIKLVFVLNNFLIGGVEKFLLDLIENFNRERFDIRIVTISGSGPLYEKYKNLNLPIFSSGFPYNPSSVIKKIIWWICAPYNITRLSLFIKKEKADIVISSMYKADIFSLFLPKKTKTVSIQHDIAKINPLFRLLKIIALKRTDQIIAISESAKNFLGDYFSIKPSKIKVIFNGINFEKFLRFQKRDSDWIPLFGVVARLEKIKGHFYLLKALKKLKENGKFPKFLFIGDGKERKKIELFLKTNDLKNVKMIGAKKEIDDIMKKIDIFVLPSLSEGLGISLIEALTSKKLIIASDVGGIKEIIKKNTTGLLTKPSDSKDIYKAINWVLENKDEAIEMRNFSFEWISKNRNLFDIKKTAEKYSKIFEELLI